MAGCKLLNINSGKHLPVFAFHMFSADRGIYVIGFTFPVVPKGMFFFNCETNVESETNAWIVEFASQVILFGQVYKL